MTKLPEDLNHFFFVDTRVNNQSAFLKEKHEFQSSFLFLGVCRNFGIYIKKQINFSGQKCKDLCIFALVLTKN